MRPNQDIVNKRKEQRANEKAAPSTGYLTLDRLVKGFIPGHLYCLSAETNAGKTALACNFTHRMLGQGARVLYLALEPEEKVIDYLASVRLDKRFDDITDEDLSMEDTLTVLTSDDVNSLETLKKTLTSADHYDLIIIDHISYFIRSLLNTNQEQSNTIKALAHIAQENQCAILMIAHLRKPQSGKEKNRSYFDISGSAAFYQDSDEVFMLYRDRMDMNDSNSAFCNIGKLIVAKTKSGSNGATALYFSNNKSKICDEEDMHMAVYRDQEH
jgi:replicative DNA helicase